MQNTLTLDAKYDDARLADVRLTLGRRTLDLLGPQGPETELAPVRAFVEACKAPDGKPTRQNVLPVVLGAGFGHGLKLLKKLHGGPIAVLDAEDALTEITGAQRHGGGSVTWLSDSDLDSAQAALVALAKAHGADSLYPIAHPGYLRLRPELYGRVLRSMKQGTSRPQRKASSFWDAAKYPKFKDWPPRVLLITTKYFLMGEVEAAFDRLGVPYRKLTLPSKEIGCTEFVESLLTAVVNFKPDFVFTINHLGVDREGVLSGLLERLELPLASWFVDNPHLVLDMYESLVTPHTAIFTWDKDNLPTLKAKGFENLGYLPLGADIHRFAPPARPLPASHPFNSRVSFVGNSMLGKIGKRLQTSKPPRELLRTYRQVAADFANSPERDLHVFLSREHPHLVDGYHRLETPTRKLAYDALLTWEATRRYRLACVEQLMDFSPMVVGDRFWHIALKAQAGRWRYHSEVSYYDHLPQLYPASEINFNATNMQMKGAVNQRVFDVPACGGFVLSDYREQMAELFDIGTEAVCYHEVGEIPELVRYYLKHPEAREKIARAGRERVLAQHSYDLRATDLMGTMARMFSSLKTLSAA